MKQLISKLQALAEPSQLSAETLIFAQKALTKFGIAAMPKDFIELLHHINTLSLEGRHLFGVKPEPLYFMDIVNVNVFQKLASAADNIILGDNEFDFLIYNQSRQSYLIVDKSDNKVLEEYSDLPSAIYNILKI